nr:class I SAM-dependent rRNA methyltransferase [Ardenticatena sp.]
MSIREIHLSADLKQAVLRGHPWIYRDHIPANTYLKNGSWVRVVAGNVAAYGIWDAHSPIAVRLFSRNTIPDAAWVEARVQEAWDVRAPLRARGDTNAYRWVYGESDGLPGIVVDLYDRHAIVRTYTDSVRKLVPWMVAALRRIAPIDGVAERQEDEFGEPRWHVHWGQRPPDELVVLENGWQMYANLLHGQKTGLFLDQRENRRELMRWCGGKRLLNCFAYNGGFSLAAALGGARFVESVDMAAEALEDARRTFVLNGLDPDAHAFTRADVFDLLERYTREGRTFDVVVLDPPSFARSKRQRHKAIRAYTRLNALALQLIPPGGLLVSSSCTAQVSHDDFLAMLVTAAARAGRRLRILHDAGHPLDHPVAPHFPEGRYLKFVIAHVVEVP